MASFLLTIHTYFNHGVRFLYSAFAICSLLAPQLGHAFGRQRPSEVAPHCVHFQVAIVKILLRCVD